MDIEKRFNLPAIPVLPASAPTLAKHLARWLGVFAAQISKGMYHNEEDNDAYREACATLAALPFVQPNTKTIDGEVHWVQDNGAKVPLANVPTKIQLEDEYVRRIASAALQLNGSLARFRALSMGEGLSLVELLGSQYDIKIGGDGGNVTFYSYDREWKVQIAAADRLTFGPEIQAARALLEQWVREQEGAAALKTLITSAFGLDQEGKIRANEVFRLQGYEMPGEAWSKAMDAIKGSIRIVGKAQYLRVYRRSATDAKKYELIPRDLASA